MFIIGGIGIATGEPDRLVSGYDFNGRICGVGAMESRRLVYYPFPYGDPVDFTWAVCVDNCPNQASLSMTEAPNMCMQTFKVPYKPTLGAAKVVTCGGLAGGKTDMSQFGYESFR